MRRRQIAWLSVGLLALLLAAGGRTALRELPRLVSAGTAGPGAEAPRLRGVFHVHSDASHDGRTPATEQLAAASRLGLDFVVFTEHNAQPVHPTPAGGPVAVPGTELSTPYGHLVYLGYGEVPPEDDTRARIGIVDSLDARGALTVLSHPTSPRRPWIGRRAGVDGLEIASTSSNARVWADPFPGILPGLFALPLNPELAVAQLYRRDDAALRMWDRLEDPSVIGLCGTDAHGWIDPALDFRTWQIVLDPWERAADPPTAGALVERLATGRFICVAGLVAEDAPRFSFTAVSRDGSVVHQGGSAPAARVSALEVDSPVPMGAAGADGASGLTTVLLRDGVEAARTTGRTLRLPDPAAGTYRVEVRARIPAVFFGGRVVPVLYSNRIRVTP
ncbi:MAG TPA: hypothetical protein ENO23_05605 [Alphaproteobacteria bacterium]|nr:hypothetical protein [Alphaproteobacteria bacterium]